MSSIPEKNLIPADLHFNPPRFSLDQLQKIARKEFGLEGSVRPLKGERDQNLYLRTDSGKEYVLKVSGDTEARSVVDLQVEALRHIEREAPELRVPRVIPAVNGKSFVSVSGMAGQKHYVRVLTFLPGVPIGDATPQLSTLRRIGEFQGQLCRVFQTFDHESAVHFMPWDISNGLAFNPALARSKFGDVERLVVPQLARLSEELMPRLKGFRRQIIHNDGHSGNLLRSSADKDDFVGVIDFGDLVSAPLVQELAVSVDSFAPCRDDIFDVAAAIVGGFHSQFPLQAEEMMSLPEMCILRACLTVQLYDFMCRHDETRTEQLVRDYPGVVATCEHLLSIDRRRLTAAIEGAC